MEEFWANTTALKQESNLQWAGIVDAAKKAAEAGEGLGGCWVPVCDVSGNIPPLIL
jgi:hypothetical protein